ncbi:MAG: hypothetical protein U5L72_00170 [Bacteroidales bacterium]|nr:hypothetical protein [Bacteroidales bacterium]
MERKKKRGDAQEEKGKRGEPKDRIPGGKMKKKKKKLKSRRKKIHKKDREKRKERWEG